MAAWSWAETGEEVADPCWEYEVAAVSAVPRLTGREQHEVRMPISGLAPGGLELLPLDSAADQ